MSWEKKITTKLEGKQYHAGMHCRNPYCNPPDFAALATEYQPLKELFVTDPKFIS